MRKYIRKMRADLHNGRMFPTDVSQCRPREYVTTDNGRGSRVKNSINGDRFCSAVNDGRFSLRPSLFPWLLMGMLVWMLSRFVLIVVVNFDFFFNRRKSVGEVFLWWSMYFWRVRNDRFRFSRNSNEIIFNIVVFHNIHYWLEIDMLSEIINGRIS